MNTLMSVWVELLTNVFCTWIVDELLLQNANSACRIVTSIFDESFEYVEALLVPPGPRPTIAVEPIGTFTECKCKGILLLIFLFSK